MKYRISIIKNVAILLTLLHISGFSSGQEVSDYLLMAKAFNRTGHPERSVQILAEALNKLQDHRLYLERAEANILKADHSGAIADFNAASSLLPLSGEYGLAKVYAIKGDAATSTYHLELSMKSDFKRSEKEIMLDPAFGKIESRPEWRQFWKKDWYSLSEESLSEIEYYTSAGKIEEASASLNELRKSYPDSEITKYAESLVDISAGRFTAAVKTLTGLLSTDPGNEKYLRTLAGVQEALGNSAGASATYSNLLNTDRKSVG